MGGLPVLVQQWEDIVDDFALCLGEHVGFRERGFRNAGTGVLAATFGDDVVKVLLRPSVVPAPALRVMAGSLGSAASQTYPESQRRGASSLGYNLARLAQHPRYMARHKAC